MLDQILGHFPRYVHALTLVSDPDNLLADESILGALAERGFALVREADPVQLRYRVEQWRPFTVHRPVILAGAQPLAEFPYDLWQQGHPVSLALHDFFPDLAYPVIRELTAEQRWRLSQAPAPPGRLGEQSTVVYLLQHVFDADVAAWQEPARFIAWLNEYHQGPEAMPPRLRAHLAAALRPSPAYGPWPLESLLQDRVAFSHFVTTQWQAYVQAETGEKLLGETAMAYLLPFATDAGLQDTVPSLVRTGTLYPVKVARRGRLPAWTKTAVVTEGEDGREQRYQELLKLLAEQSVALDEARWPRWQAIARTWAEVSNLHYETGGRFDQQHYAGWQARLDGAFLAWLARRYAPLAGQVLPVPHHLYHAPHVMAWQRAQQSQRRVALLVLDGLSLADWLLVRQVWQARQPGWQIQEQLLLAQIPTITAVSRQALVSGLRPADFAATLDHNRQEPKQWAAFWQGHDAPVSAYERLRLDEDDRPAVLSSARLQALCLVNNDIDEMLHGASLGAAAVQASLRLWLQSRLPALEAVITDLLARGYMVYLASDHGHTEAVGMGQPAEGLAVQTRSKRARIYRDKGLALRVQQAFPGTILWANQGLLPADAWVLLPLARTAFAPERMIVVSHGGATLDEVVVPLAQIQLRA